MGSTGNSILFNSVVFSLFLSILFYSNMSNPRRWCEEHGENKRFYSILFCSILFHCSMITRRSMG